MTYRSILLLLATGLMSGCVAYSLVSPGTVTVGALELHPASPWNRAVTARMPVLRSGTDVWTRDGLMLDRLLIIPAVPNGEPILKDRKGYAALPAFRAGMLPNELEELTEASVVKLLGEGNAAVSSSNLRPHRFGGDTGIMMDLEASVTDGPGYKGLAGAFIAEEKLYVMLYLAAVPHYFDKHLGEAEALIRTAARVH